MSVEAKGTKNGTTITVWPSTKTLGEYNVSLIKGCIIELHTVKATSARKALAKAKGWITT